MGYNDGYVDGQNRTRNPPTIYSVDYYSGYNNGNHDGIKGYRHRIYYIPDEVDNPDD
jgi:hypothetical protein